MTMMNTYNNTWRGNL